jgi:TetR/AcrR family transcriptional regulator
VARPRAATYDDQRAQIAAAAAQLFASRGYTATTMNQVAAASGVGKATLYHYFSDKPGLLEHIAIGHVARLEALVGEVRALGLPPPQHLRTLVTRFMQAYAGAQHEHRVLTEDVKFLGPAARQSVEDGERRVVQAYADAVAAVRPGLAAELHKPLAMLLFGMINWTFTWLKPGGALTHEALAPMVTQLYFGGLPAVQASATERRRAVSRSAGAALPA